ncbi:MAG: MFS transporter [Candidatus Dormibacteraeota bacterium]|nr:MFS transporter [Candidatus Dormibacteraeota bacterium]
MTTATASATPRPEVGPHYKWIALSNTTIGMLMATVNSSIVLISLPAIFRGIGLNPLTPGNVSYLLWMLMGYMVVTAVLVVSLGRIGDMVGRVRMYNLGFLVFTVGSILLSTVFFTGSGAALALIIFRLVQGVGGAMLFANSTAILTDAFPANQRGMALGINAVAAISGSFIGLIVGGVLSTVDWHIIFLVSVPVGLFGTVWAFLKLREIGVVKRARVDWWGNLTFGVGLIAVLVGITYGIQPYGSSTMGWTNPTVLAEIIGGVALLIAFVVIETRVTDPMFHIGLFRMRAFTFGTVAALLASIGRGGLMFMIIIWLQGIWLPLHGYSFESTPFWSAIFMLPLTVGFLVGGPSAGFLADRFGARLFATGGMVLAAITFALLTLLPADFSYAPFAVLLFTNGLAMGMFIAPNTAGVMNSVAADRRGVASGMLATFQNSGMTLSIGIFFSLMIAGLSSTLPQTLFAGLHAHGVAAAEAARVANLPPVGSLFAAFLGYNPMGTELAHYLPSLTHAQAAYLTGQTFFPNLISAPFIVGMRITFLFSATMMLIAAVASHLRGGVRPLAAPVPAAVASPSPSRRPVVTESATYGALGSVIAPQVAQRLGVPFVDRAISVVAAQQLQVPLGELEEEDMLHQPALARAIATVVDTPQFGAVPPVAGEGSAPEEALMQATSQVMHAAAATTGGVLLGRGGMAVLRDVPGVLHVRLDGSEQGRVEHAVATGAEPAEALRQLHQVDRARDAYVRAMFGIDPRDPSLYDLVLDTTTLPAEACVDAICVAAEQRAGGGAAEGAGR